MKEAFITYGSMNVKELPLHRNMGMEIHYVSEGVLRWTVDGQIETLYPGTVFFTLPWQAHGGVAVHEPGNHTHFVQFRLDRLYRQPTDCFGFHPQLDIPARDAHRVSRIFTNATRHAWGASQDLHVLIRALLKNLEQEADRLLIQGYMRSIIAELAGIVAGDTSADVHRSATEQNVLRFLNILRNRSHERWSLAAMAQACYMGRSLFAETLRKLTGDTPTDHLRRLRVEQAETRLLNSNDSITEIALSSGFSTPQLFARTFKKFTNRTPTEYRQLMHEPRETHVVDFTEADERQRRILVQRQDWI